MMTNEEAIKILKVNATLSPKATEFCEAVKMGVIALEKQIPKKLKPMSVPAPFAADDDDYECPICGNPYIEDTYCCCCGQALDWSEKNDTRVKDTAGILRGGTEGR